MITSSLATGEYVHRRKCSIIVLLVQVRRWWYWLHFSEAGPFAKDMSELEEAWAVALAQAEAQARAAGRSDLVEYLALRTSNDLLRRTSIEWINATFEILAGEANRHGASIQIVKEHEHRFRVGHATMVGSLLTLSFGVRKLSIEAGWPRRPKDGFVRGGGLAYANVKHFGIRSANEPLLLVLSSKGAPEWVVLEKNGERVQVDHARLKQHIDILLGSGSL